MLKNEWMDDEKKRIGLGVNDNARMFIMNNTPSPFFTTPELMTLLMSSSLLYILFAP